MLSLRFRLWILWGLTLAASVAIGLLLVQLYRSSTLAQAGRAEAVVTQACETIRSRYGFYVAGWDGSGAVPGTAFGQALGPVLIAALSNHEGVRGGIWSDHAGSLATAFPTATASARAAALPVGRSELVAAIAAQATDGEQSVLQRRTVDGQLVLMAACPLPGPYPGLAAWTMIDVRTAGYDTLRLGLAVLLMLLLAVAAWVTWLTTAWGGHVRAIETALATHTLETLPELAPTGERELDRIVAALNEAGARLSEAQARAQDLAARASMSERLAALGRVAAGVAHEIRNPIGAMRLRAENALAGDGSRHRVALESSLPQIARVERLVTELLAMTQRRELHVEEVRLQPFLEARVALHLPSAGPRLDTRSDDTTARFDPELIGRALDNLLSNALRHTPGDGTVKLTATRTPDHVRFTVSDTGPGIDPSMRGRLFEPFATGRPDGTGLGLAIAREMAEAHGGSLVLAEPLPGREPGACFILELGQG